MADRPSPDRDGAFIVRSCGRYLRRRLWDDDRCRRVWPSDSKEDSSPKSRGDAAHPQVESIAAGTGIAIGRNPTDAPVRVKTSALKQSCKIPLAYSSEANCHQPDGGIDAEIPRATSHLAVVGTGRQPVCHDRLPRRTFLYSHL